MGKGIVHCKDTPNFIGNRIGFGTGAFALDYILKNGFTVEEVDALSGPLVGRPKTATFRLIDLVGIDVWEHVGSNLAPAIPHDRHVQPYLNSARSNRLIHSMVERGWLGNKSKQGFYKEVRSADGNREFWTLNLSTLEYEAPQKVRFESVGKARDKARLAERLKIMLAESDRAAALVQAMTYQGFAYASHTIPEIADTPLPIDDAMRWGYGHEAGPFEIWDALGVRPTSEQMRQAGFPPAAWVDQMLASGIDCFYLMEGERKVAVYNPRDGKYQALPRPAMIILKEEKSAGKVLKRNAGASLVDLGDGVPCVEFHTKMNSLDDDIFNIVSYALDAVADGYEGLVIGSQAEHFSAGANVGMIALAATNGLWEQIDNVLKKMQNLLMRMRYFPKPVVVAPYGYTLGGGAEVTMHAGRIVAACETYAGLVEVGIGVIPAGGGTKEIVRRVISPPMRTKDAAVLPYLQRAFEQIGMAKVATSAEEARQMGILGAQDRIVMNRDYQISEAKREVLHLAQSGYQPPVPEQVYAAGRDALAALRVGIYMMKEGRYLTEYEQVIGEKLAYVLTGGELSRPTWVDEQYLLDLEREAFLSLCGEKKSQERMWTFLQTGKAIRN
jgi:3-hydroxyacyl-CoA dehydrogenase